MAIDYRNLSKQKAQADLRKGRPPEGDYSCRIVKAEKKISQKGNEMVVFTLRVIRGEQKNRDLQLRYVLSVDFAWGDYLSLLEQLGIDLDKIRSESSMIAALEQISASMPKCEVRLTHQKDELQRYVNLKVLSVEPVAVDEDELLTANGADEEDAEDAAYDNADLPEGDDGADLDEEDEEEAQATAPTPAPAPARAGRPAKAPVAPAAAPAARPARAARPY
jgi:hypothetical protein